MSWGLKLKNLMPQIQFFAYFTAKAITLSIFIKESSSAQFWKADNMYALSTADDLLLPSQKAGKSSVQKLAKNSGLPVKPALMQLSWKVYFKMDRLITGIAFVSTCFKLSNCSHQICIFCCYSFPWLYVAHRAGPRQAFFVSIFLFNIEVFGNNQLCQFRTWIRKLWKVLLELKLNFGRIMKDILLSRASNCSSNTKTR